MSIYSDHNEGREPTQRDVQQILRALREGSTENPDVLGIEIYNVMQALNKGFPKHMYHASLEPVQAKDKQDEKGLREIGYVDYYIPREFPRWIYRRNFHPKFRPDIDLGTNLPKADALEFIESRLVQSQEKLDQILKEPTPYMPQGIPKPGPWVMKVTEIPPIEHGTEEEHVLEMARLQGQLEEARRGSEIPATPVGDYARAEIKRRGRPKKAEQPVA